MSRDGPSNDLESLAEELNSAAIHLTRRLRRADESLETTPARLSALSVLVFGGPRRITDLAKIEQVTSATMSKIASAMVEEGLVSRSASSDDGRVVILTPTPKGTDLMHRGRQQRVEKLADELEHLPDTELSTLWDAVEVLRKLDRERSTSRS